MELTPTAPAPSEYSAVLTDLRQRVRDACFVAQGRVNTGLVRLQRGIGRTILQRQDQQGWGGNVIGRLAADLRAESPEMKGLWRRIMFYMRRFAGELPVETLVQQAVGQVPWGHITVLLDRLDDHELRNWYAGQTVALGWSWSLLEHQIRSTTHTRLQVAPRHRRGVQACSRSVHVWRLTS